MPKRTFSRALSRVSAMWNGATRRSRRGSMVRPFSAAISQAVCQLVVSASKPVVSAAATHSMPRSYLPASRPPDGVTALATATSGNGSL